MKTIIKTGCKRLINSSVAFMGKTFLGAYIQNQIISNAMSRTQKVVFQDLDFVFSTPNPLNKFRADTFSTKEPETLEWMDTIPQDSVVWDIGANVGLYTCYLAKARNCRVFAFEPSVFNLELLARNIFINKVTEKVTIVPLPLSEELSASKLNMTTTDWGGAMSTFGQGYGHDGEAIKKVFEFPTIGLSIVDAVNLLNIPQPDYIKMDVDGIEHLILKGGLPILYKVKGVLVEINDKFTVQANDAGEYLKKAGFFLKEKRHADYFDSVAGAAKHTYNQIWAR